MREIKFRAWNYKENKMDYDPYGEECLCEGTPINDLFTEKSQGYMNHTLMQYTGLKDKNGKEIYEGDIVGYPNKDIKAVVCFGPYSFEGNEYGEYRRYGIGFYLEKYEKGIKQSMKREIYNCPGIYSNVIGNIYENPELLNQKNNE